MVKTKEDHVMIIGGYLGYLPYLGSSKTHIFDLISGSWMKGPNLLQARARHGCTVLDSGLTIVAGGYAYRSSRMDSNGLLGSVEILTDDNSWMQGTFKKQILILN